MYAKPSSLVLGASLLLLLIGVMIPGYLRDAIEASFVPRRLPFSSLMHLLLFASCAAALCMPPFQWRRDRIMWAGLLLALSTEAMQHFAVGRHPRLRDVAIDLSGVLLGMLLVALWRWRRARALGAS